ncbi:MAG: 30S ribosomal protein S20 [Candidatus Dadabacteria bacterium]|nr:MAG: 30S ribosomal protein S20 [Candidatus Dadabacteria bacterium]
MPTHKSAAKRLRQNIKKRERNRRIKTTIRTIIKKTKAFADKKDEKEACNCLLQAEKLLASAATKGVIHKNNYRHRLVRLHRYVKKALTAVQ